MIRRLLQAVVLGAGLIPAVTSAQTGGRLLEGVVQSQMLVIDFERVFSESDFGLRVATELEAAGAEIAQENRRIEAELTREEQELTLQRDGMAPDDFRTLAQEFDEKVQQLRREQDAKARALGQRSDEARRQFLGVVQPVLQRLMIETGALVILERRTVFVSADAIDVTALVIERVNEAVGDGAGLQTAPRAPEPPAPDTPDLPEIVPAPQDP